MFSKIARASRLGCKSVKRPALRADIPKTVLAIPDWQRAGFFFGKEVFEQKVPSVELFKLG
jgi:hypothetical protein